MRRRSRYRFAIPLAGLDQIPVALGATALGDQLIRSFYRTVASGARLGSVKREQASEKIT